MQKYKGDDKEQQFIDSGGPAFDATILALDEYFESAYESKEFTAMLYDESRAPFANAIRRDIFIDALGEIIDFFTLAGSFESYLLVFTKIFGEDVDVVFTVPGPGKLNIEITALGLEESLFVARQIVDNNYLYDEIVDDVGDNIVFSSIKGFTSQYDLEQMLFEMVPAGIFCDIDLEIG